MSERPAGFFREQFLRIAGCDYRLPLKLAHAENWVEGGGCGCQALCLAGRGGHADGGVSSECFTCDLAAPPPAG